MGDQWRNFPIHHVRYSKYIVKTLRTKFKCYADIVAVKIYIVLIAISCCK